jgi:hypothetical protein
MFPAKAASSTHIKHMYLGIAAHHSMGGLMRTAAVPWLLVDSPPPPPGHEGRHSRSIHVGCCEAAAAVAAAAATWAVH